MKLDNQAIGALMMALQKSLMEQSDIVPVLKEMNFMFAPDDPSQSTLIVSNPPVVDFGGVTLADNVAAFDTEE
jgi:hypothetical protein